MALVVLGRGGVSSPLRGILGVGVNNASKYGAQVHRNFCEVLWYNRRRVASKSPRGLNYQQTDNNNVEGSARLRLPVDELEMLDFKHRGLQAATTKITTRTTWRQSMGTKSSLLPSRDRRGQNGMLLSFINWLVSPVQMALSPSRVDVQHETRMP